MALLPEIRYPRFLHDGSILSGPRWKLRRAMRVMNQVLSSLSLEQHPDKTFIGRTQRGFDFLGVQFTHSGETSPSAVNLARHTEKTAQLYEQGTSLKRIEQYRQNWLRYLRGILGKAHPATKATRPIATPQNAMPTSPLSSHHPSHRHRQSLAGDQKYKIQKYEKDSNQDKRPHPLPRRDRWGRLCFVRS